MATSALTRPRRHLIPLLFLVLMAQPALAVDDHLLLCEAALQGAEFIEITNPTTVTVDLGDYYLSDDQDYARLPGASGVGPSPSIHSSDFIVRFPSGAFIAPYDVVVVALDGAAFESTFGFEADFEIEGTDPETPDMVKLFGATPSTTLTDGGENAVLFFWDGDSDLVQDVDMFNIGTPTVSNAIGDKTALAVDGPDLDTSASVYAEDYFSMPLQADDPGSGESTKQIQLEGLDEVSGLGGNGLTGDDETTEDILLTWDSSFIGSDPDLGYALH